MSEDYDVGVCIDRVVFHAARFDRCILGGVLSGYYRVSMKIKVESLTG